MGAADSKPPKSHNQSMKKNKRDSLTKIEADIASIRRKVEDGDEVNCDLYRSQLLITAGKVQEIRTGIGKKKKKGEQEEVCSRILDDINKCIALLEAKERDDARESNLDLGAVESHSFISQDINQVLERKVKQHDERIKSLTQIKGRMSELDEEIRAYVADNDIRSLIIVEKKLNLLYNDLEEIDPAPHTPDMMEKERLAGLLIKYNKKINNVKRKSGYIDGSDGGMFSKPPPITEQGGILEVLKIIHELGDLEVNAFTFEDVRNSPSYTQLEQKLKKYYTTLENVDLTNDDERRKTLTAKNLIKKILSSLKQRAIENENLMAKQLIEIENIQKEIADYRTQSEYLTSKESTNFLQIDQKIRSAWDKLNQINTQFSSLKYKKETTIADIQNLLKTINDNCTEFTRRESRRKQLKEFKAALVDLKRSDTIRHDENSCALLEEIEASLKKFLNEKKPDVDRAKKHSVASVMMDQLVTEMTSEMIKVDPVEDLRNISEDVKITPVVNTSAESMGRIQMIERDITTLRTSIRNFSGTTESEMYDGIEDKLLKHKTELESIQTDNRIVSNAKDRTLKKIDDTNLVLRSKAEANDEYAEQIRRSSVSRSSQSLNRRSAKSINKNMQSIMSIDSNVHDLERQIRKFNGTSNDKEYALIVEELNRSDEALKLIDISGFDNLESSKMEVLNHVNRLQIEIVAKASENESSVRNELEKLKEILRLVKQIKKKVDCFNGTYRNIQYEQLENDLKFNLENVLAVKDINPKIIKAKQQTRETIEKYMRILDERSVKPQPVNTMTLERAGINLLDIKNRMEYFAGSVHDDEYFQIIRDLHVCNDDIKTLTDEGEAGERKMQYLQYIQELFNYFDAKMNNRSNHQSHENLNGNVNEEKIQESLQKLDNYIKEADQICEKIQMYDGGNPASEYSTLDEKVIDLMIQVDKLYTYHVPEIREKRKEVMEKLTKCSEVLDEKCRPFVDSSAAPDREKILAEIENIMEEVDMLNDNVRHFEGTKNDHHYVNLDESLIRLFLKLDSVNPYSDAVIKNSKLKAMKVIKRNMKLLEEKVNSHEYEDAGAYGPEETLV